MWIRSLGQEDPLEKEMATHSIILAWEIPGTEEPTVCDLQRSLQSVTPGYSPWGHKVLDTTEHASTTH